MYFTFQFETPGSLVSNPMRWALGLFRIGPLLLNTPAYEHMGYVATQTSFIEALENRVPAEMVDGNVYIGDKLVGRTTTFGECISEYGFEWPRASEREMGCVLALEDIRDAKTNSLLLRKGCYYGTPSNILDARFKANVVTQEPFLKLMSSVVPNFESRLNRVIAHINGTEEKDGSVSEGVKKFFEIERHRRGGFRFLPKCKIIFREE